MILFLSRDQMLDLKKYPEAAPYPLTELQKDGLRRFVSSTVVANPGKQAFTDSATTVMDFIGGGHIHPSEIDALIMIATSRPLKKIEAEVFDNIMDRSVAIKFELKFEQEVVAVPNPLRPGMSLRLPDDSPRARTTSQADAPGFTPGRRLRLRGTT